MNTNTAIQLLLSNPTAPVVGGTLLLYALILGARVYTFRLAIHGAKPSERPVIMREHRNMWRVRRPQRY
ncbi:hypothetical protein ACWENO_04240 [Streptomyces sp. NPDC004436]